MESCDTGEHRTFLQPTRRRKNSASDRPWRCGGAGVSLRQEALDHAARKNSRPLLFIPTLTLLDQELLFFSGT